MWKKVLAATAVLAIAGTSFVHAQRAGGPEGPNGRPDRRPGMARDFGGWQLSVEDMSAFADARIAGMKAGLRLTPDQEKNWPAFESAYRGLAKLRMDRIAAMREARQRRRQSNDRSGEQGSEQNRDQGRSQERSGNMVEFMQRRADAMVKGANAFKLFAAAAAPLYQSLDDGQKRRFGVLARMLRPRLMNFARGMHGRDERGERGFGPGGPPRFGRGFDRPRFGAADGLQSEDFAAINPPLAEPDLADFDLADLGPEGRLPGER
jgi:hypothetical protein